MDRENYSRVTDVLGAFSGIDRVPEHILAPAADRGTRVHLAIDGALKGLGEWVDADIQKYMDSYKLWLPDVPKVIIDTECRFWCDELRITGQVDLMCEIKGERWLIDFKTSSKPQTSWPLQISAYEYLAGLEDLQFDRVAIVHLMKDGSVPKVLEYEDSFGLFLECLNVYKYFYKNGKRLPYEVD